MTTTHSPTRLAGLVRCEARQPTVQAVRHLGDQADVKAWVARVSLDPFIACESAVDGSVVVTERARGSIRRSVVRPGDVAVQVPGSQYGWDVCEATTFRCNYTLQPRELPIFDDGERV